MKRIKVISEMKNGYPESHVYARKFFGKTGRELGVDELDYLAISVIDQHYRFLYGNPNSRQIITDLKHNTFN
ncbi:MAG: hypothetical protein AABW91_01670 [Nanoarchaeota archaeon]